MSTFRSQCTLRKESELLLAEDIAHAISALSRISTDLKYMSDIIYKRLTEADFLTFDFDLRGGPLLSKGERKLLEEINIYYSESKQ